VLEISMKCFVCHLSGHKAPKREANHEMRGDGSVIDSGPCYCSCYKSDYST